MGAFATIGPVEEMHCNGPPRRRYIYIANFPKGLADRCFDEALEVVLYVKVPKCGEGVGYFHGF
jgi:hypothetical protein